MKAYGLYLLGLVVGVLTTAAIFASPGAPVWVGAVAGIVVLGLGALAAFGTEPLR